MKLPSVGAAEYDARAQLICASDWARGAIASMGLEGRKPKSGATRSHAATSGSATIVWLGENAFSRHGANCSGCRTESDVGGGKVRLASAS
jgi:hypothetical protein